MDEPAAESKAKPHKRGAEAALRRVDWWGFPALLKERDPKSYRPKSLDDRLRKERTKTEVRLLVDARRAGVRTPIVYDVDLDRHRIILEELPGPTLKELLEKHAEERPTLQPFVRAFGEALGRLHGAGMSHGDLTSSNVLYPDGDDGRPALLDLSMGSRNASVEELGIDLHLVEEDLKSLHPDGAALFRVFLTGYDAGNPGGAKAVRKRAREIRGRVRYA
ncbi:MAG: Kae1-associated serine/threonine protein kinase [Thermoplasmata archaeon]|nr:Kae1-associated serine/threonine protein kinase [Thermoplasmata archaeon]